MILAKNDDFASKTMILAKIDQEIASIFLAKIIVFEAKSSFLAKIINPTSKNHCFWLKIEGYGIPFDPFFSLPGPSG